MKHTKKTLGTMLLSVAVLTSCADMDPLGFNAFEKPANIEGMEYLADYDALKEYKSLNSSVSPDFKLGMALSANDYNANGIWTRLANANFDEVVAGNEMKMASIVNDQGKMDFGTVNSFVNNADVNGMNVYGHTLAWHSQQPVKWLNSLLKDKPIPIPEGAGDPCLAFDNGEGKANPWDSQGIYELSQLLEVGKTYTVKASLKSTAGGPCALWPIWDASPNKDQWGGSTDLLYLAEYNTTTGFTDYEWTFTLESFPLDHIKFVFGKLVGTLYIDNFSCKEQGSDVELVKNGTFDEPLSGWTVNWGGPQFKIEGAAAGPSTYMVDLIDNGDMEGSDAHSFATKSDQGDIVYEIIDGVGVDGSRGAKITSKGGYPDAWESQFWIVSNETLVEGDKVYVSFDYRADGGCAGTKVDTQAHYNPGGYHHWACAGSVQFTDTWQTYEKTFTVDAAMHKGGDGQGDGIGMNTIAFNMSPNTSPGAYYIDNVVLQIEREGEGIPLTPEEKKDTLTWAMDQWVAGMMEACDGKVKAWDVVNEPISGGDPDAEGVYALQHDPDGAKPNDFYWQDYLGDLDYVRTVVKFARQYGPEDIKLFVNDYNLESDWDNNQKLKSLIAWIKRWEADGVTKIDGIGTQMHLSYYSNPDIQASKEKHIVEMFKLLAASGKLVRVSELDIEFKDEQGNNVVVEKMTDAQLRKVSDFYKWIIQQYIANVPAAQQYGFCIWTAIDADPSTSWTHNQLYGLWNKNFNRTHAYAGFADGLGGK